MQIANWLSEKQQYNNTGGRASNYADHRRASNLSVVLRQVAVRALQQRVRKQVITYSVELLLMQKVS